AIYRATSESEDSNTRSKPKRKERIYMDLKRKPPRSGGGSKEVIPDESDSSFLGRTEASADLSHAELLTRASKIIASSIFSNRLTSPEVHAVEEALRIVFEDAAAFHHRRGSHFRHDAGFLFEEKAA